MITGALGMSTASIGTVTVSVALCTPLDAVTVKVSVESVPAVSTACCWAALGVKVNVPVAALMATAPPPVLVVGAV